jgi:uncharacterized protein involved in exopolysaccharide biosynthesis
LSGGAGQGSSGSPEAGNSLQGDSLAALNRAVADATARRVAAEGAYRAAAASGPGSAVTTSTQGLRNSRAQLEAEYSEKRASLQPDHPEMISLRERIAELGQQINRESAQVSSGVNNTLAAEYRGAVAAERALQARVNALKGEVLDLRGRSVRYGILQREVDTNRSLYDALLGRYKEVGVAGGIGTSPISIVDPPESPGRPFTPNLPRNLLAGLALGLLGGLERRSVSTCCATRSAPATTCAPSSGSPALARSRSDRPRATSSTISRIRDRSCPRPISATAAALRFTTEHGHAARDDADLDLPG